MWRRILIFIFLFVMILSLYGLHAVCVIFYSNYFSQVVYEAHVFPGMDHAPTRTEIFFMKIRHPETILKSLALSAALVCLVTWIQHRRASTRNGSGR